MEEGVVEAEGATPAGAADAARPAGAEAARPADAVPTYALALEAASPGDAVPTDALAMLEAEGPAGPAAMPEAFVAEEADGNGAAAATG